MTENKDNGEDTEVVPVAPPHLDDGRPRWLEYPDWNPETSRVVSGPCGAEGDDIPEGWNWGAGMPSGAPKFPGRWFPTVTSAREWYRQQGYKVHQDLSVAGRWILRVSRRPVRQ